MSEAPAEVQEPGPVSLTKEDLAKIMAALDIAVKTGGLNTAAELLPVADKINAMSQAT